MTRPATAAKLEPLAAARTPEVLVVLDFDGLLVNSYELLKSTFAHFGLDVGDENRFKHRRKFLKYLGGGREVARNLVSLSLPKKRKIRERLTDEYVQRGRIFPEFTELLNMLIGDPAFHVGIVSRNFTRTPGLTIRAVLRHSAVNEKDLDFVIPIPVGVKKGDVLEAMRSPRYRLSLLAADEVGDFRAAEETGYLALMACYGFDSRDRLVEIGGVPPERVFNSPAALVAHMNRVLAPFRR